MRTAATILLILASASARGGECELATHEYPCGAGVELSFGAVLAPGLRVADVELGSGLSIGAAYRRGRLRLGGDYSVFASDETVAPAASGGELHRLGVFGRFARPSRRGESPFAPTLYGEGGGGVSLLLGAAPRVDLMLGGGFELVFVMGEAHVSLRTGARLLLVPLPGEVDLNVLLGLGLAVELGRPS